MHPGEGRERIWEYGRLTGTGQPTPAYPLVRATQAIVHARESRHASGALSSCCARNRAGQRTMMGALHQHRAAARERVAWPRRGTHVSSACALHFSHLPDYRLGFRKYEHIQRVISAGCDAATGVWTFALDRSELWHSRQNRTRIGTVLVRPGTCARRPRGQLRSPWQYRT